MNLFDDQPLEELTPALANRLAAKRAGDAERQRRKRARDKAGAAPLAVVTDADERVTPQLSFELSRAINEPSRDELTPELQMMVRAFHRLAVAGIAVDHESLVWALDELARADGLHIFNARRYLESAIERRVIPTFSGNQWATVPRATLERLMRDNKIKVAS